jgi:hypothetical protein
MFYIYARSAGPLSGLEILLIGSWFAVFMIAPVLSLVAGTLRPCAQAAIQLCCSTSRLCFWA